ncbi:cation:proton antiporter [Paracoccus pacificus]|uniref:Cation:proton antiporter n=1 Tax=Paracoccus pacificus TaxID=1463598 RepID=A0ABW4R2A3_9RHOB
MDAGQTEALLNPVQAIALVGMLGVGAQWLAWRFQLPAIVLMLAVGLLVGPATGLFIPDRDIGPLVQPLISVAVAIILFEGGLTLNFRSLADARPAVRRLVWIGGPLGWLFSSLALAWGAGLGWESSIVFGGVMIVTGPTVIAPMLRQARLPSRPAQVLQWEAIVNDPIGVLVAVLALEAVLASYTAITWTDAFWTVTGGIAFATAIGLAAGVAITAAFRRNLVPEYMKVPVLFVTVLAAFALADTWLHESGLLAVTIMGLVIANAELPSYSELYRFKEHATILLVSGVFILIAASMDFAVLGQLNWRAGLFVLLVVLVARPLTVLLSLRGTNLPFNEQLLIALTGPRGVVLVAVSGIFGNQLVQVGIEDGALIAPLAFALVLVTVVLHGFTLAPLARSLGVSGSGAPGLLIVGGNRFTTGLAKALKNQEVDVLIADPNLAHLRLPRSEGIPVFYGDILGEAAENSVEFIAFQDILAATDNDAYNTLVATDLAPEFGRDAIWQVVRHKDDRPRHSLPAGLGGQTLNGGQTLTQLEDMLREGWIFRTTRLTDEYTLEDWRAARPGVLPLILVSDKRVISFVADDASLKGGAGTRIISLIPPEIAEAIRKAATDATPASALSATGDPGAERVTPLPDRTDPAASA